jgi:hypothetical protein
MPVAARLLLLQPAPSLTVVECLVLASASGARYSTGSRGSLPHSAHEPS